MCIPKLTFQWIATLLFIPFFILGRLNAQVNESTLSNFLFGDKSYYEITAEFDSVIDYQNSFNQTTLLNGASGGLVLVNQSLLKKYGRWKTYWSSRIDSEKQFTMINDQNVNLFNNQIEVCSSEKTDFVSWKNLGPFNDNGSCDPPCSNTCESVKHANLGRAEYVAVDLDPNSNALLLGTQNGGVYKLDDNSSVWRNTTHDENISFVGEEY